MAQQVKALTIKLDSLSSIPGTHGERRDLTPAKRDNQWGWRNCSVVKSIAALEEDESLVPSTHLGGSEPLVLHLQGINTIFWVLQAPERTCTYTHTQIKIH